MDRPLIFEDYNFSKASTQFPLIQPSSSAQEVEDTAWQYTIDVLNADAILLQEVFIGEYLDELGIMESYHKQVLQAVADKNYQQIGRLVEECMAEFNKKAVAYIEQHQIEMEH